MICLQAIPFFGANNLIWNATLRISCHRKFQRQSTASGSLRISACVLMHSFRCARFGLLFAVLHFYWPENARKSNAWSQWATCKTEKEMSVFQTNDKFQKWEIWCDCRRIGNRWNNININIFSIRSYLSYLFSLNIAQNEMRMNLWMENAKIRDFFLTNRIACQFGREAMPVCSLACCIGPFVIGWTKSKIYSKHSHYIRRALHENTPDARFFSLRRRSFRIIYKNLNT